MRLEDTAASADPKADSTTSVFGVYECTTPEIGITAAVMFGLAHARNYRNFDAANAANERCRTCVPGLYDAP